MPSLQVRELPEHIYFQLCREAEKQHRSIAQQAVTALAHGLHLELDPKTRRINLMTQITSEPIILKGALPADPALLIREDRER